MKFNINVVLVIIGITIIVFTGISFLLNFNSKNMEQDIYYLTYSLDGSRYEYYYNDAAEKILTIRDDVGNEVNLKLAYSSSLSPENFFLNWGRVPTNDTIKLIPPTECSYFQINLGINRTENPQDINYIYSKQSRFRGVLLSAGCVSQLTDILEKRSL